MQTQARRGYDSHGRFGKPEEPIFNIHKMMQKVPDGGDGPKTPTAGGVV